MKQVFEKVEQKLTGLNIPKEEIQTIVKELDQDDLLTIHNEGALRSDRTRKTYFKETFDYVAPAQMYLGTDNSGKERFCQYVPLKNTLSALFKQSTVREQYSQCKTHVHKDMVLNDVNDGRNVKENIILQESPSSVSVILYQDAFEVTNPLGSGKKKHKIMVMYMTLGEILPHNRSTVDPTQHVLLCREQDFKSFGQDKVFACLIADLQDVEDSGFHLEDGSNLKASLIAICGDNLGSHCIGGFTENFSSSKHF